jgi:hypothetical protein
VIPERYWKPVSDVVWSWPSRGIMVLGILIYTYLRSGGALGIAKGVAWLAVWIVGVWAVPRAWKRLACMTRGLYRKRSVSS